jgi:DNA-directed RNA polymerase subunit RPC12/RpoP
VSRILPGGVVYFNVIIMAIFSRGDLLMDEKIVAFKCKDCGMIFWARQADDPRFCPFCESALLMKNEE